MKATELKKVATYKIDERTQLFELNQSKETLKAVRANIDEVVKKYIEAAAIKHKHSIINYNSFQIEVRSNRVWVAVEGVWLDENYKYRFVREYATVEYKDGAFTVTDVQRYNYD